MKLLVTGGIGFIGSNFIIQSLSNHPDHEIINLDKIGIGANPENLKQLENRNRYRFIKGDISDPKLVQEAIKDVDVVVNFAAETHVDRSIADPKPFLESNIIGTFNLLEAERKLNKPLRHIQISTDETYGDITQGSFKEEDRLKPSNPYSATKAAADMLCQAYHRTYGLDIIVTRCTNNFGPHQFPEKLIPKTIIRAQKNLQIPVYGTGENVRDWIYVLDHCEAIDLTLRKGKSGETYNISSGNELSTITVVNRILKTLDKPEELITFVEDRPGHDVRYSLDSSKIRGELGWKPKHSFEEALKKTVEWYLENDWWWKPMVNEETLHPTPWKLRK
jgi:dTDP-glucose 4,6-dehydratase